MKMGIFKCHVFCAFVNRDTKYQATPYAKKKFFQNCCTAKLLVQEKEEKYTVSIAYCERITGGAKPCKNPLPAINIIIYNDRISKRHVGDSILSANGGKILVIFFRNGSQLDKQLA
jgi:hypothetical protein